MSPKMLRLVGALGALAVVVLISVLTTRGSDTAPSAISATATPAAGVSSTGKPAAPVTSPTRVAGVPERAYTTLAEIDAGRWPDSANAPGTKGGERWMNRDGDLPRADAAGRPITYQEWDVNPKQRNRTRDAERIVTGSDGSAWYTGDHYQTFTRMR
ncbi:guanyl-specific ribonuclease [Nocardia farcinica]|uniref:ribonuclease domain-containing protein n=1 Tax=Nocardia farcinica TaxID=37329 RepID=UPI001E62F66E|nr:ribonuclease domain-containing protein [Nocardia farcinica]